MKRIFFILVLLVLWLQPVFARTVLDSPYSNLGATQYKGQLHAHANNGGGVDTPAVMVTAYRDIGYNFICLTGHDVITADPEVSGITYILGEEKTATEGHLGRINVAAHVDANGAQDGINATEPDGIARPNHPSRSDMWTDAELATISGYKAIEIYNANGDDEAMEKWDLVLGLNQVVYGMADDDCHDIAGALFNKGWVMAFADSNTLSNIMTALRAGKYYASTGADITSITVSGATITIVLPVASTVTWIKTGGATAETDTNVTTASYTAVGNEVYVRANIVEFGDATDRAWINPSYITTSAGIEIKGVTLTGVRFD